MKQKFIKLKIEENRYHYVNPLFITSVLEMGERCAIYTMDSKTIYPLETVDEVMKKIKEANEFTITL
jgi:hypothetical protein